MSGSEVDGMSHAKTDASSHANTDASSRSNADPMSRSAELARSDAAPTAPARSDATAQATSLFERGYAVFEHLRAPHEVARLRAALDAERARLDPPALYAPESRPLDDDAFLTTSGLALPRFLPRHPALFPLVLDPRLLAALRQLLGPLRLELAGGMISDPSRPFFRWHTHIDGEDEGERVRRQAWPAQRAPRLRGPHGARLASQARPQGKKNGVRHLSVRKGPEGPFSHRKYIKISILRKNHL